MSLARPVRCLWAGPRSAMPQSISRRCMHSSLRHQQDDKKNPVLAERTPKNAATNDHKKSAHRLRKNFPAYTPKEREELEKKYTPTQLAAIDAGEAAIDIQDVVDQGALRDDPMAIRYIDDFSTISPVVDKRPQPPEEYYDPNLRYKGDSEIADDLLEFIEDLPEDADPVEVQKFIDRTRLMVGKPEAELQPIDYRAPVLPKINDPLVRQQSRASKNDDGTDEMLPYYERLSKVTGLTVRHMKSLRMKVLVSHRVVNQTRLGKISRQYFLTVVGNRNGMLGIGEGKSAEAEDGRRQSIMNAIRNLTPIPRYEERTIFGDVQGKSGATELTLYTRPPGFGIRCQDKIYEMCKCAGISDMAARVTRARNPMNTIKAAFQALMSQRNPEEIARARGKKLVDVRKVYNVGNV